MDALCACAMARQQRPSFKNCCRLGGGLIGFGFGFITRLLLRVMQRWGASAEQQIALTVAGGYLVFYTANSPADVSGVLGWFLYLITLAGGWLIVHSHLVGGRSIGCNVPSAS